MISTKTCKTIEYDKILAAVSEFAVLGDGKRNIQEFVPVTDIKEAQFLQDKTTEAYKLLYKYNTCGIIFCENVFDELKRVDMGGTLNNGELLRIVNNLKSARIIKEAILSVKDDNIKIIPSIAALLFTNREFENEVTSKIISDDEISDNASPKLFSIRKAISDLNARIRDQLNSYMRGNFSKYLQESVVTMRRDRYVVPVKSEYRNYVKGFIHDQSSSGATVFIEPEQVMELNNDLKRAMLDEANEIQRILRELTNKVSCMTDAIRYNYENQITLDECFARAQYSFYNKCTEPLLNDKCVVDIKKGRHPLIAKDKVVPIDVSFGSEYRFLLITGPNTGGKTVTLKLIGLLSLMAMSGLYIPAADESKIAVFDGIYCDIGDEQSIEQNLSTFSSHIKNIIEILNVVDKNSLILLDELGAGTDPEEGSALALAIIEKFIELNCCGIITTHYSELKEFAAKSDKICNASMEFDAKTLKPLYKLNVGIPGSSNAIDIAKTLGLKEEIIRGALSHLSKEKISFENILKKAEESRRRADELSNELDEIKNKKQDELSVIAEERDKIIKEREKIYATAKAETKKIVADKLEEAEEIIGELKEILKRANLESKDLFKAGELRNRLKNSKYLNTENDALPIEMIKANPKTLKEGDVCFVKSLKADAVIAKLKPSKSEAEVTIGNVRTVVKFDDLYNAERRKTNNNVVKITKKAASNLAVSELNVIGKTSYEALSELENFLCQAVMHGLTEVKVIHGVGEGILLKAIRNALKNDKRVLEFRRGNYGEGENGVTIITLK